MRLRHIEVGIVKGIGPCGTGLRYHGDYIRIVNITGSEVVEHILVAISDPDVVDPELVNTRREPDVVVPAVDMQDITALDGRRRGVDHQALELHMTEMGTQGLCCRSVRPRQQDISGAGAVGPRVETVGTAIDIRRIAEHMTDLVDAVARITVDRTQVMTIVDLVRRYETGADGEFLIGAEGRAQGFHTEQKAAFG